MDTPSSISHAALGRARGLPQLGAFLELTKPITWFPPIWAYMCGLVASGVSVQDLLFQHAQPICLGLILAGPAVCGTSQVVNDWFDRGVDAINQPERPIPSGRVAGRQGLYFAIVLTLLSAGLAAFIGPIALLSGCVGLACAWGYSAPPLRLKKHPIFGAGIVGLCYEGLPWVTATALALGALPSLQVFALAGLYSVGAYGIMVLNDFKAVRGDRLTGVRSLPALVGLRRTGAIACMVMAVPQMVVIALLSLWGHGGAALLVLALLLVQLVLMRKLLSDPVRLVPWYSANGVTLFVLGMLVCSFAVGDHSLFGIGL